MCVWRMVIDKKVHKMNEREAREEGGRKWQKGLDPLAIVGSCSAVACHCKGQNCRPQQNTGAP